MKLYLGSDHGGFELKEQIKKYLKRIGFQYEDLGNDKLEELDDYPVYASAVAKHLQKNKRAKGLLFCGNGVGVCMVANKFKGIRAVNAHNVKIAKESRADDDTNVLCLAGRHLTYDESKKIIKAWLETPFKKERKYKRRIEQFKDLGTKK